MKSTAGLSSIRPLEVPFDPRPFADRCLAAIESATSGLSLAETREVMAMLRSDLEGRDGDEEYRRVWKTSATD